MENKIALFFLLPLLGMQRAEGNYRRLKFELVAKGLVVNGIAIIPQKIRLYQENFLVDCLLFRIRMSVLNWQITHSPSSQGHCAIAKPSRNLEMRRSIP